MDLVGRIKNLMKGVVSYRPTMKGVAAFGAATLSTLTLWHSAAYATIPISLCFDEIEDSRVVGVEVDVNETGGENITINEAIENICNDGRCSIPMDLAEDSEYSFTARSYDSQGNKSIDSDTIFYNTGSASLPETDAPVFGYLEYRIIDENTVGIKGSVSDASEVRIMVDDGNSILNFGYSTFDFIVDVVDLSSINLYAKDIFGNINSLFIDAFTDSFAPEILSYTIDRPTDVLITYESEWGVYANVYNNGNFIGTFLGEPGIEEDDPGTIDIDVALKHLVDGENIFSYEVFDSSSNLTQIIETYEITKGFHILEDGEYENDSQIPWTNSGYISLSDDAVEGLNSLEFDLSGIGPGESRTFRLYGDWNIEDVLEHRMNLKASDPNNFRMGLFFFDSDGNWASYENILVSGSDWEDYVLSKDTLGLDQMGVSQDDINSVMISFYNDTGSTFSDNNVLLDSLVDFSPIPIVDVKNYGVSQNISIIEDAESYVANIPWSNNEFITISDESAEGNYSLKFSMDGLEPGNKRKFILYQAQDISWVLNHSMWLNPSDPDNFRMRVYFHDSDGDWASWDNITVNSDGWTHYVLPKDNDILNTRGVDQYDITRIIITLYNDTNETFNDEFVRIDNLKANREEIIEDGEYNSVSEIPWSNSENISLSNESISGQHSLKLSMDGIEPGNKRKFILYQAQDISWVLNHSMWLNPSDPDNFRMRVYFYDSDGDWASWDDITVNSGGWTHYVLPKDNDILNTRGVDQDDITRLIITLYNDTNETFNEEFVLLDDLKANREEMIEDSESYVSPMPWDNQENILVSDNAVEGNYSLKFLLDGVESGSRRTFRLNNPQDISDVLEHGMWLNPSDYENFRMRLYFYDSDGNWASWDNITVNSGGWTHYVLPKDNALLNSKGVDQNDITRIIVALYNDTGSTLQNEYVLMDLLSQSSDTSEYRWNEFFAAKPVQASNNGLLFPNFLGQNTEAYWEKGFESQDLSNVSEFRIIVDPVNQIQNSFYFFNSLGIAYGTGSIVTPGVTDLKISSSEILNGQPSSVLGQTTKFGFSTSKQGGGILDIDATTEIINIGINDLYKFKNTD